MLVLLFVIVAVAAVRGMWSPCGLSMLSSLNPVSERARGHRFWVTACWYTLGALAGGALLGAGCAVGALAFGWLGGPASLGWSIALAGAVVAALSDARVGGWSLPMHPRQVDERWLTTYRRWIYAAGYGVQIGSGFATYIMTAGVYLTALLAVLTASPSQAFIAGLAFGVLRGMTIAVAGVARDPQRLAALLGRIESLADASSLAACTASAAVAVSAAWRLGGAVPAVALALALGAVVTLTGGTGRVGSRLALGGRGRQRAMVP
jgi:hypothetical protein